MKIPARTYSGKFMERELFALELNKPDEFPDRLSLPSPRFACLLAWDASKFSVDVVGRLARKLLDSGAVYSAYGDQIASAFTTSSMKRGSARIRRR